METYFPCEHDIVPKTIYRCIYLIEALRYYQKYRGKSTGIVGCSCNSAKRESRYVSSIFNSGAVMRKEVKNRGERPIKHDLIKKMSTVPWAICETILISIRFICVNIKYSIFNIFLSNFLFPPPPFRLKINSVSEELNSNAFLREKDSLLTFQRGFKKMMEWSDGCQNSSMWQKGRSVFCRWQFRYFRFQRVLQYRSFVANL